MDKELTKNLAMMLKDPFYLKYHLMPPGGWLNDPNGLCQMDDTIHIFYQYAYNPNGGLKHWGHYTTKDYVNYKDEGITLYPDVYTEKDGVYSGAAFVENGMHLFYTGNVKFPGKHDYIHSGRGAFINYVYSKDGMTFSKKETLLSNINYPADMTCHVRDPKIIEKNGLYSMVLGARDNNDVGCALVYNSLDLKNWKYAYRIDTETPFGYMWECPDLETVDGQDFLITCPQGIQQDGYKYENKDSNGYFKVDGKLAYDYQVLDYGYDYYAPQCFRDSKNRLISIAWMGIPDIPYKNPTVENGWQMALTLPRVITNVNGELYQYPVEEILSLRKERKEVVLDSNPISLEKTCWIQFQNEKKDFHIRLGNLGLSYENALFTLSYLCDGYGRTSRHIEIEKMEVFEIFMDTSCFEIFINKGQKVMTCRNYSLEDLTIESNSPIAMQYAGMNSFHIQYK
ncbi:MAG: glycoside hydrolase family 32 protein [Firmicutes bacterium]|nr:glycoside hydrolase family 32 protein [Bacillota bacterium]